MKTEPVKGGWWQNVYVIDSRVASRKGCGWTKMEDGRWLYVKRFPSRDIAETERDTAPLETCACFALDQIMNENYMVWDEAIHFKGDA